MTQLPILKMLAAVCIIAGTSCQSNKNKQMTTEDKEGKELTMLVGTYTSGSSKGIYSFRFDETNGTATPLSEIEIENPSYLTPSADGKLVYAVSELNDEKASVSALAFNEKEGTFKLLNTQLTHGEDPCYITTNGSMVVAANYSGGSISVFPIAADGALLPSAEVLKFNGSGADKGRQDKPHLHCTVVAPDGDYLFATDLGTDQIYKYQISKNQDSIKQGMALQKVEPTSYRVAAGSGPRHLTFSPNGNYAYLIHELSGTVVGFEYHAGNLKEIQTIVADTLGAQGSADIHISPDGKYLYASNRLKGDGLAIFHIDASNGMLTKVGYQPTKVHPRNFCITPNGKYLLVACRDSNAIQVFERDQATGELTDTQKDIVVDKVVCIQFVQ